MAVSSRSLNVTNSVPHGRKYDENIRKERSPKIPNSFTSIVASLGLSTASSDLTLLPNNAQTAAQRLNVSNVDLIPDPYRLALLLNFPSFANAGLERHNADIFNRSTLGDNICIPHSRNISGSALVSQVSLCLHCKSSIFESKDFELM